MKDTPCDDILMAMMAEADGEQSSFSAGEIRSHLDTCENCRREFAQTQPVDSQLKMQTRLEQSANLWPAIEKQLRPGFVSQIGWTPFVLLGVLFVAHKLFEMLPERAPAMAFKLVPLVLVIGLFVFIRENPFRINAELTLER